MTSFKWQTLATDLAKKRTRSKPESSFNRTTPKKVRLSETVRLIPFDTLREESLKWYQDPESMRNIVGVRITYTKEQIQQMYEWQNDHGLLYYIEYKKDKKTQIIGDVWLAEDDYAIVIDKAFRDQHIGRMVTKYFIYKSKKMGRDFMTVSEIFNWNKASQKMFTRLDFFPFKENKDSWSYRKRLKNLKKDKHNLK